MLNRIKRWLRRQKKMTFADQQVYSREEVIQLLAETRSVAYNDGRRDGLSVAREQATKSLKELLWAQNQTK